ncbi:MAG: lipase secretion chaperone [Myxococcota bacterium]|nr:lipase secretion chaperone [Myxococcota bacterium]
MRIRLLVLAGLGAVLALALARAWWGEDAAIDAVDGEHAQAAAGRQAPGAAPPPEGSARRPLPASLRGTDVDGAYSVDARGRFLPSPAVLRRFDYFLSVGGEEPEEVTRARIVADIEAGLPPRAAAEAVALLDDYLAYRRAGRELHARGLAPEDLERRLQRVRELRREFFGAERSALLFGEEEALALAALERARIARDPALDEAERARRLEAVDAELPASLGRSRRAATLPQRLARQEAALRDAGADPAAIRSLREAEVGAEAADRLEALDAARRAWEARVQAYRAERDRLLAAPDASADALEALRRAHFEPAELARVRGLDRIDGVELALQTPPGA